MSLVHVGIPTDLPIEIGPFRSEHPVALCTRSAGGHLFAAHCVLPPCYLELPPEQQMFIRSHGLQKAAKAVNDMMEAVIAEGRHVS